MRASHWLLLLALPASHGQTTFTVSPDSLDFTGIHSFLITNPWGPGNVGNIQSPHALTLSLRSSRPDGKLNWRVQAVREGTSDFADWLTIRNLSALGEGDPCGTPVRNGTGTGRQIDCRSSVAPIALEISYTIWWSQLKKQRFHTASLVFTDLDDPANRALVRVQAEFVPAAYYPTLLFSKDPAGAGCTSVPAHYPHLVRCTPPSERPPYAFAAPEPGQSYQDEVYGGRVRPLSPPGWSHAYSSLSPFNLTGDVLIAYRGGSASAVRTADFSVVAPNLPGGGASDWLVWSRLKPNILYHAGTPRGPVLQAYDVVTRSSVVIRDFTPELGPACPGAMCRLVTGGQMDASRDDWLAFQNPAAGIVCAYDAPHNDLYCANYPSPSPTAGGEALISKGVDRISGKRYVILNSTPHAWIYAVGPEGPLELVGTGPTFIGAPNLTDYDPNSCNGVQSQCLNGGHHDTVEDEDGIQYLVNAPYAGGPISSPVYAFQLNKAGANLGAPFELGGGTHQLFVMQYGFGVDLFPNYHIGCAREAPYCVISTGVRSGTGQRQGALPGWKITGVTVGKETVIATDAPVTLKEGDLVNIGGVAGVSINGVHTVTRAEDASFAIALDTSGQIYQAGTGACAPGAALDRRSNFGELILVKVAAPGKEPFIRKIAMHRSVPTTAERDGTSYGYFAIPRAALSSDASQILFATNFGEPSQFRMAIAETGAASPPPVRILARSTSVLGAVITYAAPVGEACELSLSSDGAFSGPVDGATWTESSLADGVREWRIALKPVLNSNAWYAFRINCPSGAVHGSFVAAPSSQAGRRLPVSTPGRTR